MVFQGIIERLPFRSKYWKLVIGAVLTAVAISLGMVAGMNFAGLEINPVIPSAMGAAGGAIFAAKQRG